MKLFLAHWLYPIIGLLLLPFALAAQPNKSVVNQNLVRLIRADSVGSLVARLNEAGQTGYRVKFIGFYGSSGDGLFESLSRRDGVAVVEKQSGALAGEKYEYRIEVAEKSREIEATLTSMSKQGWRFLLLRKFSYTTASYNAENTTESNIANLLLFERPPSASTYEYRVLPFHREKTGERLLADALAQGFRPLEMTFTGEPKWYFLGAPTIHLAYILEREVGSTHATGKCSYEVVATNRVPTFEKEVNTLILKGWHLLNTSQRDLSIILSDCQAGNSIANAQVFVAELPLEGFLSKLSARRFAEAAAKQMEKGRRYYRFLGGGQFFGKSSLVAFSEAAKDKGVTTTPEILVLNDGSKAYSSKDFQREIVYAKRGQPTFEQVFDQIISSGYQVKDLAITHAGFLLIFEK